MYNIIDTRNSTIVAQAQDYDEAKSIASCYRKQEFITSENWKLIQIKKKKEAPIRTFFIDDGCCDSLRDRRMETFGMGFRR